MKKRVAILGATGMIGQHYVSLLHNHPLFEIACLIASKPAKSYAEAMEGRWHQESPIPQGYELTTRALPCDLYFSTLGADVEVPEGGRVIASAACYREHAPVIIPEINPYHIQDHRLICKPNCAVQSFLLPLAPLHKLGKITALSVTTLQAMSGAGNKGMEGLEGSIIPYIADEEEKLETEPLKILDADFPISAQVNRVPILHGHMACVSVSFEKKLTREDILACWSEPSPLNLPSAPKHPIVYHDDPTRPRAPLDLKNGMEVHVGRLRPCPLHGWRFVALSHNAIRGGAGGGILIGELLYG